MSMTANLHGATLVQAQSHKTTTWLHIRSSDNDDLNIFMPLHVAEAMARAYLDATQPAAEPQTLEAAE